MAYTERHIIPEKTERSLHLVLDLISPFESTAPQLPFAQPQSSEARVIAGGDSMYWAGGIKLPPNDLMRYVQTASRGRLDTTNTAEPEAKISKIKKLLYTTATVDEIIENPKPVVLVFGPHGNDIAETVLANMEDLGEYAQASQSRSLRLSQLPTILRRARQALGDFGADYRHAMLDPIVDYNKERLAYHAERDKVQPVGIICTDLGEVEKAPEIEYGGTTIKIYGYPLHEVVARAARRAIGREIRNTVAVHNSEYPHIPAVVMKSNVKKFDHTGHPTREAIAQMGNRIAQFILPHQQMKRKYT